MCFTVILNKISRSTSNITVTHCNNSPAYCISRSISTTAADHHPATGPGDQRHNHTASGPPPDSHPHTHRGPSYPHTGGKSWTDHTNTTSHTSTASQTVPGQSGVDPRGTVSGHWSATEVPVSANSAKVRNISLHVYASLHHNRKSLKNLPVQGVFMILSHRFLSME